MTDDLIFNAADHSYTKRGRRFVSVTECLPRHPDLDRAPLDVLTHKQQIGSSLARAAELDVRGLLKESTVDEEVAPYLYGWRCFVDDTHFEPILELVETPLCSETWGYAGTPDIPGILNGRLFLPDLKTLFAKPGPVTGLQLAGYEKLIFERTKQRVRGKAALWLTPDKPKPYRLVFFGDPNDWNNFVSHLNAYKWQIANGYLRREAA